MFMRIFLPLLLLISQNVFAGAASPQGVWSGTLGSKAIMACFNVGSQWTAYASYYYADHLIPIALASSEKDLFWREYKADDAAVWELNAPLNGAIVGNWRNPKTQEKLPIKLSFVDGGDDEKACARDSYNTRLEITPKVEIGKVIQFSPGRSYRKLHFAGQETIELSGPDPAINRINSELKPDQSQAAIQGYFEQRREFLGRIGYPAVDDKITEPTYWNAHFIAIRVFTWVAGEGRSGISNEYRTWNTKTGEEVDLWEWIGASASDQRLSAKLQKYLYVKESPECEQGYRGKGYFTLMIAAFGLRFDEEDWGDGCAKSFIISFRKLQPFLSPAGKRAVRSIIGKNINQR